MRCQGYFSKLLRGRGWSENNKIVIADSRYCGDNKAVYFALSTVLACVWIWELNKSLLPNQIKPNLLQFSQQFSNQIKYWQWLEVLILVLFDIGQFPSFWSGYAGSVPRFKHFLLFIHFKHVILAYLVNFIWSLYHIFYVYMALTINFSWIF